MQKPTLKKFKYYIKKIKKNKKNKKTNNCYKYKYLKT